MMNDEFLKNLFQKQLTESLKSLEDLEKRNTSEYTCLTLLSSNMKSIESN
jgi:hypothetical protein